LPLAAPRRKNAQHERAAQGLALGRCPFLPDNLPRR
jgi:hypothetical protein